ncbi:MAG TPA: ribonuclease HI family protein [Leptolinea sp.]
MYTLQFDGLFRRIQTKSHGNPGIMCYGWLILRDGSLVAKGHGGYAHWKIATSNGAEYLALIAGLEALLDMNITDETILIQGDAKTIIEQMQNLVQTHSPRIKQFHRQARRLCRNLKDVQWNWTPRRENHSADRLTRRALQQIRSSEPVYFAPDVLTLIPTSSRHGLQPILHLTQYQSDGTLLDAF